MASYDATTVLDEANAAAVRMTLGKMDDQVIARVHDAVSGVGLIGNLAAQDIKEGETDV